MSIKDLIAVNESLDKSLDQIRDEIINISIDCGIDMNKIILDMINRVKNMNLSKENEESIINNIKNGFSKKMAEKNLEDRVKTIEEKLSKIQELLENFINKFNK